MRYLLPLIFLALLAVPTLAAEKGSLVEENIKTGGFEGPVAGAKADTVAKAIKLGQDESAVLTGNVIASLADEKNEYIFKDGTGEINVRISPKQFRGNVINPQTRVRLIGKIDKSDTGTLRLKVSSLEVLK